MDKIYGIDLGTTFSLIGYSDEYLSELTPSVADIQKRIAGEALRNDDNATRSFKINISLGAEGSISIAASRLVLEELKRQAGEDVKKVVITVPAYFSDNQRQATVKAANLAGLEVVTLINEPTAAAIYLSKGKQALSVIYDLGGGTFDVSVIDSRFDNYDVQASDGCVVGGDNLDNAILRHLMKEADLKRHNLTQEEYNSLARLATKSKIRLQKAKGDIEVDLTPYGRGIITLREEVYKELMKLTFADTILKTRRVIQQSIPSGEMYNIILVGGSTRCPYLREWLAEEFGQEPEPLTYDPDRVVAQGAAAYAHMLMTGEAEEIVSDVTKALSIGMDDGSARHIISENSKVPIEETTFIYNNNKSQFLRVNLYQGNSLIAANNELIGTLVYDYGKIMEPTEGEVIVTVTVEHDGIIHFSCKQLLGESVEVTLDRGLVSGRK